MGSKGSNTTTTNTAPNPAAMSAYQALLERSNTVGNLPYNPYQGTLTAGINDQQNLGISGINQYANAAQPNINQATQYATQLGAGPTQANINSYLNPYTQNVVDQTQAQFARSNAAQQNDLRSRAAAQGALGGSREKIAAGDLAYQQSLGQAPVIAGLYNQGYNNALNSWSQNTGNAANMLGNLGVAGQQAGLAGAGAQVGAGGLQQHTDQARLSALYNQFQIGQAFPYQQTQWLAGLQTGVGSQMGGTSNTTGPAPNPFAQFAGPALMAYSMMNRGGGVRGYDEGGAVEPGISGTPWGGVSGFIPGMNLTRGQGAPPPPRPPQQPDETKGLRDAMSFMKGMGGRDEGVAGAPDWWSPAPHEGDIGEWQGPSASEVYRSGGTVKGYATRGFVNPDDDGVWSDDLSFSGKEQGRMPNGIQALPFAPDESPDESQIVGAQADAIPLPRAKPEMAGVSGSPPTSDGSDMGWEPAPRSGSPSEWQGAPQGVASSAPSAAQAKRKGLFGLVPDDMRAPLFAAGAAMAASRSPFLGNAIGEGGLAGFGAYQHGKEKAEDRSIRKQSLDMQARRLDEAAQRARETLALRTRALDEQTAYRKDLTANRDEKLDKPQHTGMTLPDGTPIMIQNGQYVDGITKEPIQKGTKLVDPKARVPVTSITDENANLHGDDFLKTLSPNEKNLVKGLAEYTVDPKTLSTMGGTREKYLNLALQYDPGFRQQRYNETYNAVNRFSTGPQGNTVRSFNVAIHHLGTLEEASKALQNGDIQKFNQLKNYISTEMGHPEPTNFEGVRNIMAAEIVKAITGAGGSLEDRRVAQETISRAGSPAQLMGIIGQYKKLMAGQVLGLKKQYEDATGLKNFESKLMPETVRQMGLAGGEHAGAPATAPQAGGNDQNARALDWANKNPNDPRAVEIKRRLGVQ